MSHDNFHHRTRLLLLLDSLRGELDRAIQCRDWGIVQAVMLRIADLERPLLEGQPRRGRALEGAELGEWDRTVRHLYGEVHLVFESGTTACHRIAFAPPSMGAVLGVDFRHELALTPDLDRVDCQACLDLVIRAEAAERSPIDQATLERLEQRTASTTPPAPGPN